VPRSLPGSSHVPFRPGRNRIENRTLRSKGYVRKERIHGISVRKLNRLVSKSSGKLIYAENDPNRPRFTLLELKDILQERNGLKSKISDLEEELAVFRPRSSV
jgi:hypothetical protein